jgi:hypothetical protein
MTQLKHGDISPIREQINTKTVHKSNNVSIHSGSAGTFFCQSFLFKDDDLGIVLFTNCNPGNSNEIFQTITNEILDEYLKK